MPAVFISHSSVDNVLAHGLARLLREHGYDSFLDFHGIPGGAEWEKEIYGALRESLTVLVCATPAAMTSRWVFAEMAIARFKGTPVIPLKMQQCDLPTHLAATTQHIDLCTEPEAGYAKLWIALEKLQLAPARQGWPKDQSPYPGLVALQEEHDRVFFGRERDLEAVLQHLRPGGQQRRFVAIVGPSGSGKSSLVRAGLVPALKRGAIPRSEHWLFLRPFVPGTAPFLALAERLRALHRDLGNLRQLEHRLKQPKELLYALLEARADCGVNDSRILMVIDQLEEIERRTRKSEASEFISAIKETLADPESPLLVVATLRADLLARCLRFTDLAHLLTSGTLPLGAMERAALRSAIIGPAKLAGIEFEDGLVERIVEDTTGGDALPLMADTLYQLWNQLSRAGARKVTHSDYDASGGVQGNLARRAPTRMVRRSLRLRAINWRGSGQSSRDNCCTSSWGMKARSTTQSSVRTVRKSPLSPTIARHGSGAPRPVACDTSCVGTEVPSMRSRSVRTARASRRHPTITRLVSGQPTPGSACKHWRRMRAEFGRSLLPLMEADC